MYLYHPSSLTSCTPHTALSGFLNDIHPRLSPPDSSTGDASREMQPQWDAGHLFADYQSGYGDNRAPSPVSLDALKCNAHYVPGWGVLPNRIDLLSQQVQSYVNTVGNTGSEKQLDTAIEYHMAGSQALNFSGQDVNTDGSGDGTALFDLRSVLPESAERISDSLSCSHCSRRFNSLQALKRHERCHRKSHPCNACNQSFAWRHHLERHMNTHLKPADKIKFKCKAPECFKIFTRDSNMRRHLQRDHDLKVVLLEIEEIEDSEEIKEERASIHTSAPVPRALLPAREEELNDAVPSRLVTWTSPQARADRIGEALKRADSIPQPSEHSIEDSIIKDYEALVDINLGGFEMDTGPNATINVESTPLWNIPSRPGYSHGRNGKQAKRDCSDALITLNSPYRKSYESMDEPSEAGSICDSPEAGQSSTRRNGASAAKVSGGAGKRKGGESGRRPARKRVKIYNKENDGDDPASFPAPHADPDPTDGRNLPCFYGVFDPNKYPRDPCQRTTYEFAHLLTHLKTRHHRLYVYDRFISNCPDPTQPIQPSHSQSMSVQSSQTTFLQSSPPTLLPFPYRAPSPTPTVDNPPIPTLYVAVCRLCWNDFEDYSSLMAHYPLCAVQEPAGGPIGRWRALRRAFCVKLFHRRYPHIVVPAGYRRFLGDIAVPHHPQHRHHLVPEERAPESLYVSRQAFDALTQKFDRFTQMFEDLRREHQALVATLLASTTLSVTSAAERSEVLRGIGGNISLSTVDASPGGFRTAVDQVQAVPASQPHESRIAFPPVSPIQIDPHDKRRTSEFHDSGVTGMGSSVSQTLQNHQSLQDYQTAQDLRPSQQFYYPQGSKPSQRRHALLDPQPLQVASEQGLCELWFGESWEDFS